VAAADSILSSTKLNPGGRIAMAWRTGVGGKVELELLRPHG
jgi:hypothetical protein